LSADLCLQHIGHDAVHCVVLVRLRQLRLVSAYFSATTHI